VSTSLPATNQGVFESGVSVLLNTKTSGESTNRFDLPWLVAVIAFAKRVGFKEEFLKDNGYVLLRLGRH
jgi:hypothetical protein